MPGLLFIRGRPSVGVTGAGNCEVRCNVWGIGHGSDCRCTLQYRLDRRGQGFLRLRDWGAHDNSLVKIVETLTTRYMRRHLRLPSAVTSTQALEAYLGAKKAKEVSTLKQMRELAAAYAFQRASQSKNTGVGPIEAALRFVDVENTGRLGKYARSASHIFAEVHVQGASRHLCSRCRNCPKEVTTL